MKITAGKPKHYDMLCLAVVPKKPPDVSRLNENGNKKCYEKPRHLNAVINLQAFKREVKSSDKTKHVLGFLLQW